MKLVSPTSPTAATTTTTTTNMYENNQVNVMTIRDDCFVNINSDPSVQMSPGGRSIVTVQADLLPEPKIPFSLASSETGDIDDMDDLISGALSELSQEEREKAMDEMHGVNDTTPVESDFLDNKVLELQQELYRLIHVSQMEHTKAFRMAEAQNAEYVYHQVFCERFLQAAEYDVTEAATKMIRFYEWKLQLWGAHRLTRDIEMDDLDEHDIEVLKKGYFQVLPERDRSGRPVHVAVLNNQTFPSTEAAGRAMWYTFQTRLDEVTEPFAVGVTIYQADPTVALTDPALVRTFAMAYTVMPIRNAAYHHCVTDPASSQFKSFLNHMLLCMDNQNKAKSVVHGGQPSKYFKELLTFGIPPHLIPLSEDGKIKLKNHMEFLQGRKVREQYAKVGKTDLVSLPLRSDILLGRGKPIQQAPGNLRLAAIVDSYVLEYHKLVNKQDKTALASDIVRMVKSVSARFLTKESGVWMEVTDDIAREKVSGLFRTLYRTRYSDVKAAAEERKVGAKSKFSGSACVPLDLDERDQKRMKVVANRAA
eukprot:Nitzschia sp. Nitz4//scaffold32_size149145//49056//50746//NITZ4_002873-RA/size149145-processed-gene-0.91-mRNA-1//1//CDS//3329548051//2771//frame0